MNLILGPSLGQYQRKLQFKINEIKKISIENRKSAKMQMGWKVSGCNIFNQIQIETHILLSQ